MSPKTAKKQKSILKHMHVRTQPRDLGWLVRAAMLLPLLFGALGVQAQVIHTVAGNGTAAFSGDGGPAVNASLFQPFGVFLDASGNLFIADSENNCTREVFGPNPPVGQTTGHIITVAGNCSVPGAFSGDGGPATNAALNFPRGIFVDPSGNLFIADTNNFRIREVFGPNPPPGQTAGNIVTVAGNGTSGLSGDGGPAINAQLSDARGVFVDQFGNLFVSDSSNDRIREVFGANPPPGQTVGNIVTVAGGGTGGDGGPATSAGLSSPRGNVFVDSNRNIFIPDTNNQCLREVFGPTPPPGQSAGNIVTIAGSCGTPGDFTGDGGPATAAKLHIPFGVVVDAFGNVFFADTGNFRIREIFGPNPPAGQTTGNIITVAGNGTSGFSGDGGSAVNAMMDAPSGLFVDPLGTLFIADTKNNRIREVDYPTSVLSPTALAFGSVNVGTSTSSKSATLSNPSKQPLSVASISITGANGGDFVQTNTCGTSVAAGANCTIDVTFTPTAAGARSAKIVVSDSVATHSVDLTGTGAAGAPQASLSASSLTFGSQAVGTSSAAQTITLTNGGNASLSVSSIAITGTNTTDFTETDNCGSNVAAGASCTINVTFKPTASGSRTVSLTIADNAANSPQSVSLTGTGVTPAPQASLSSAALTFGSQGVGTSSAAKTVTLTNQGNASLSIASIAFTGTNATDFTGTDNCGSNVAAGASCTINVTFKPTAGGSRTAFLTIGDSAANSPQSVNLTGTATDFSVAAAQGGSTSATVTAGQAASYSLQLTGTGAAQSVSLICTGAPQGAVCTVPATVSLTPGTPAAVNVGITTTAKGVLIFAPRTFRVPNPGNPTPVLWTFLLTMLSWVLVRKQSRARGSRAGWATRLAIAAPLLLLALTVAAMSGCTGQPSKTPVPNGTPTGTYTLTLTGTSNGVSRTTQLTLTVQ